MPGVPDVYQGCELTGQSLVDPDNRRPVDYARRRELLADLDAGTLPADVDGEKLLITSRALRLRGEHPDWFASGYEPLAAEGPAADHALAFRRGGVITVVPPGCPPGYPAAAAGAHTHLPLPGGPWRDLLTDQTYASPVPLAGLFGTLPVALLVETA